MGEYMNDRAKTIICDIDGTLIKHFGSQTKQISEKPKILPGVIQKLEEWDRKGYKLILATGRRESTREITEKQLNELGIYYDQLIMGLGGCERVLINDLKMNNNTPTATALNIERNKGIKDVEV
tara:strand:+ start:613 stop:984 length:372 start_codon:yes stop_codon:yes gene_type:complete